MKNRKNSTLRIAGGLLALVMVTSCFVGGTFAKYTTAADATESARVAKFGVEVGISGGAFETSYDADDNSTSITKTVVSSDADKLAAPGTEDENAVTFTIKGAPETAVRVQVGMDDMQDIVLKKGAYRDYTKAPYDGTFQVPTDYHPIAFYLKKGDDVVVAGSLADINGYLRSAYVSGDYQANTNLGTELCSRGGYPTSGGGYSSNSTDTTGVYTLYWHWVYEHNNAYFTGGDAADTLLGNLAADADTYAADGKWNQTAGAFADMTAADYNTDVAFKLTISVTQID